MDSASQTPEVGQCPVCRSEVSAEADFCGVCGSQNPQTTAIELRSVDYLLSELAHWEADGSVNLDEARVLREKYENLREELRAQIIANGNSASHSESRPDLNPSSARHPSQRASPRTTIPGKSRRAVLETLADPRTIRLLLYTGAAMLVVGIVISLRDILYLKLREPVVQAALLAVGTTAVTLCGWLTILRTRLLLTGRALALVGSLLVPVNFWFLVRSGLISSNGSAWMVCAFCAVLYANTAVILREKLYLYLASVASIFTAWTIIYRIEQEAVGLYALALMILSLAFLHLGRLLRVHGDKEHETAGDERQTTEDPEAEIRKRHSLEWGPPLTHVALVGASISALMYMPWRLGSSSTNADEVFRLRSIDYDSSVAMLLFAMGAYAAWFTGRYVYTTNRRLLYTVAALALVWTEFVTIDGLAVSGPFQLLILATTAFILVLTSRMIISDSLRISLRRTGLIVIVVLAVILYPVLSVYESYPLTHGMILVLLAATYAVSGSSRSQKRGAVNNPSESSIALACASLLAVQAIIHLRLGDSSLRAPVVALGAFGVLSLCASVWSRPLRDVHYFRAGLYSVALAFVLGCLHTGFDPAGDVEVYTTPVAVLMLGAAYFSIRRGQDDYGADTRLLLWGGSVVLSAPLLVHALQYRLLLDRPTPWRDLTTLGVSLGLILLGAGGRLRAPALVGATSLALELLALTLTSVGWLQIPLKVYLVSVGALILVVWGLLEFRREQILLVRKRLKERREDARERIDEWR